MKLEKEAFLPHQLKTIEIDAENRIFKMNGKEFGNDCTHFEIVCDAVDGFRIEMKMYAKVERTNYDITGNPKD